MLKTECESGLMPPLAAGSRSRAIRGAEERRRDDESMPGTFLKSASRPLATQSSHRHSAASVIRSQLGVAYGGDVAIAWQWTYLRRQLAIPRLWRIVGELQERKSVLWTLKPTACISRSPSLPSSLFSFPHRHAQPCLSRSSAVLCISPFHPARNSIIGMGRRHRCYTNDNKQKASTHHYRHTLRTPNTLRILLPDRAPRPGRRSCIMCQSRCSPTSSVPSCLNSHAVAG